jgi:ribulose-phosphate 3-epimerase
MLEIIPAIIPESVDDLSEKLSRVAGLASVVQIDFVDGVFVPDATPSWPFHEKREGEYFRVLGSEEDGLPFWDSFFFEADLMVKEPEHIIDDIIGAGFSRVILHAGSSGAIAEIFDTLRQYDIETGLAVHVGDDREQYAALLEKADVIQVMGIKHIGRQGERLSPEALNLLSTLREQYPERIISVDGGVNVENAPILVGAGADRLVSGSALFGSDDIATTLAKFYALEERVNDTL